MTTTPKFDLYQTVTDKIINAIEAGIQRSGKPLWSGAGAQAMPFNRQSGNLYSGVNILILWFAAQEFGFESASWLTYKQAKALGGTIKAGSKGQQIVYYSTIEHEDARPDTGEIETKKTGFLKSFTVFNLDQCEGIEGGIERRTFTGNDAAERVLTASGAQIREQGGKAFYRPSSDEVYLPERARFVSDESFYAVALHELTHWTGGPTRLNRDFSGRFGEESYAFEELIAELGAAFVCADLSLIPQTIDGHASYIESWLRVLKGDKKAIFTAASQASKAHGFLMAKAAQETKKAA